MTEKYDKRRAAWLKALDGMGYPDVTLLKCEDDENDNSMTFFVDGTDWFQLFKLVEKLASRNNIGAYQLVVDIEDY